MDNWNLRNCILIWLLLERRLGGGEILCVDRSWAGVRKVDKEVGHQLDIVRTMVDSLLDILLWTKKIKRNLYK